jgi:hypothetical protein
MYGCITVPHSLQYLSIYRIICNFTYHHYYLPSTFLLNDYKGASNDIMQATRLAKAMVTQYGLSEKVGIIFIDDKGI